MPEDAEEAVQVLGGGGEYESQLGSHVETCVPVRG